MIKIAHESPKSIFKEVQKYTDYDYALVHLFEEDPEYLKQFQDAKEAGREIILDNSIFELEEAFDAEKFAGWVLELKPDWYIVPDALEDAKKTVQQMTEWNNKYKNLLLVYELHKFHLQNIFLNLQFHGLLIFFESN